MKALFATLGFPHIAHGAEVVLGAQNVSWMNSRQLNSGRTNGKHPLTEAAKRFRPDWIFIQLHETQGVNASDLAGLRSFLPKTVITNWVGDVRKKYASSLGELCRGTHATLLSHKGQRNLFASMGATTIHYCQNAISDKIETDYQSREFGFKVPDIVFCGNIYAEDFIPGGRLRIESVRILRRSGFDVGVVGDGWPPDIPVIGQCTREFQRALYGQAKMVLSISHFPDIPYYWSRRHLLGMVSGTPVVTYYVRGMEDEFTNAVNCYWYKSVKDLVPIVRFLIDNPQVARQAGAAGRMHVLRKHKWSDRIRALMPLVHTLRVSL